MVKKKEANPAQEEEPPGPHWPRPEAWGAEKGGRHGNSQIPPGTWGLGARLQ